MDSQKPKESNDVRFISLGCIVFELYSCKKFSEFPAESGCKANDLTRYRYLGPIIFPSLFHIGLRPIKHN